MKKALMLISLIVASANIYATGGGTNSINLGEKNIYSETGFETNLRSSISSPVIIDAKTIENKKYTSVSQILNDISVINGLDMRGQGKDKLKETVQLLVDGVAQNFLDSSHLSSPTNVVNVDNIERIEIIPGGGAVLYGSGTSGGVINIITKRHTGTYGNVGYRYGSYNNNIADIGAGTSVGNFDFNLSYRKNKTDGYRNDNDNSNSDYFSGKVRYNINDEDYFTVQYNKYQEKYKNPNSLTKDELDKDRRQSGVAKTTKANNKNKKDEVNFVYNNKINENYELNLDAFYEKNQITGNSLEENTGMFMGMKMGQKMGMTKALKNPNLPPMAKKGIEKKIAEIDKEIRSVRGAVYTQSNSLFGDKKLGIKLKNKFTYGNGSNFILGLGYLKNHLDRKSKWEFVNRFDMFDFDISLDKNTAEIFGINTYKYDNFEFTQGLRFERANYKGSRANLTVSDKKYKIKENKNDFAGNLAVNYLYSDTGNVYVKYERGFTSPNPAKLMDKVKDKKTHTPIYVLNNLKSEKTDSFEIGWNDYLLNSLVSADVYYSKTKDEIKTIFDGGHASPDMTFRSVNLGKTRRYGLDLKAEQKLDKFTFNEAYSYVNAKIVKDENKEIEGKYISDIPAHKFVLGVDYEVNNKFNIGLDGQYTSDYYLTNSNKIGKDGKKVVFNLRADYQVIDGLNVYTGINNLFNNKYNEDVSVENDRRTEKEYKVYNPAATRNYYAGFSYKF